MLDEAVHERLTDSFSVLYQPWTQCSAHLRCFRCLLQDAKVFAYRKWWFNVLKEINGKGIALVQVGDVGKEASFGVLVGEDADV
jgi:hypothetical protein